MELVGAWIDRFGHVEDVQLPLGGVTLLFGMNGAGKTTLVSALKAAWVEGHVDAQVSWLARLRRGVDDELLLQVVSHGAAERLRSLERLLDSLGLTGGDRTRAATEWLNELGSSWDELTAVVPQQRDWDALVGRLRERLAPPDTPGRSDDVERVMSPLLAEPLLRFRPRDDLDYPLPGMAKIVPVGLEVQLAIDTRSLTHPEHQSWLALAGDPALDGSVLGDAAQGVVAADRPFAVVANLGALPGWPWKPSCAGPLDVRGSVGSHAGAAGCRGGQRRGAYLQRPRRRRGGLARRSAAVRASRRV
ncbi:MAG: ATP-binding protein [Actinomycetota bacterium]|nr:ATP-binding protein [Actinomycetota bacterium]